MNLKKIWNKILDGYGYNEGTLFFWKDRREYHRIRILTLQQDIANTKSVNQAYTLNVRLQSEVQRYDIADLNVRQHAGNDETEPGWRNN